MSGFLAAIGVLLPFADPDLSYPLPAGADLRVGRPSQTAGPMSSHYSQHCQGSPTILLKSRASPTASCT